MSAPGIMNPLAVKPARALPRSVAVIGAGTIGPDIGYYLKTSIPDLTLYLVDVAPQALERAVERLKGYAQKGLAKGKLTAEQAAAVSDKLIPTLDYSAIAGCDWVLEAATENLELKRKIFAQIEAVVRPDALITSNTSSLPASRLFSGLAHPGRATVTHFFAPAHRNPAVEVVRWERGDEGTLDYLRWLFCQTGKVPVVTGDALCFMLDRVFDNWCNEAALLLDRATAAQVDTVASDYVQAGPFFVLNLARGNPIIVETNTLQMEEGAHYRPADIFRSVDTWKTAAPGKPVPVEPAVAGRVRDRLLGILFSQSFDIVDRGIGDASDLNLGCALALGFKRGPFDIMAEQGEKELRRILDVLSAERPGMPQPKRKLASYQEFYRHLLVDDLDGVKLLTLRRPQAMNALDDTVTDELLAAIEKYENDSKVSGFVIVGYGSKAFCAGADIGRFPEVLGKADAAAQYARDTSRLLVHLDQMKKPVVAALNGMALGGGLELAIRCHGIVAVKDAWLQFPEVSLGIAPGIGGMVVPYRRWPKAAEAFHGMLRLSKRLKAVQAHELGIIDGLAGSYDELVQLAAARVKQLAGKVMPIADKPVELAPLEKVEPATPTGGALSREVVELIGAAIQEAAKAPTLAAALEIGYRAFGASACTAAAKEGITAFLDKRKPDFGKTG
ncbi:MAG: 3-hydroxyacyl-CoA dehydrogenase/enoyl-CoA hydratase family protein [Myxococcaceae bacterium]